MARACITDEAWRRLAPVVRSLTTRGPRGQDDRRFLEAVAWVLRTGAPWRDLPSVFGRWSTIYRRFRRWALAGRWHALRDAIRGHANESGWFLVDSSIVKAHGHAAGASHGCGGQAGQALGRSRGGFSTKIHALVSTAGHLTRWLLTGGQVNDITQAKALTEGLSARGVVGDRAYDSDAFVSELEGRGIAAVIPPRAGRRHPRRLDAARYGERNVIERLFGRLKQYRRVATRYDKTIASYDGALAGASLLVELSRWRP